MNDCAQCYHYFSYVSKSIIFVLSKRSNVYVNNIDKSISGSILPFQALWNFILGHLSYPRLSTMSQLYHDFSNDNKSLCYICHFARQKRTNTSNPSSKFDLIHFDI